MAAYPQACKAAVQVTLADGSLYTVRRRHALGDPEMPLSAAGAIAKAR